MKFLGIIGIIFLIAVFLTPAAAFCQDHDVFENGFAGNDDLGIEYPNSVLRPSLNAAPKSSGGFPLFIGVGKVRFPNSRLDKLFLSDPITREFAGLSEGIPERVDSRGLNINENSPSLFSNKIAGVIIDTPEELFPMVSFSGGASYVADFSGNKIFQSEAESGTDVQKEEVGAVGAFLTVVFVDTVSIAAEFMTATNKFEVGGLNSEYNRTIEPKAWNFELSFIPLTDMEVALRYGGSKDTGNYLHKLEYGGAVDMGLFKNTSLALEYIYKEFENKNIENSIAARFAVDF